MIEFDDSDRGAGERGWFVRELSSSVVNIFPRRGRTLRQMTALLLPGLTAVRKHFRRFVSDGEAMRALHGLLHGGDPFGHGQSKQTLLGKLLRIDVDHLSGGLAYGIPADNPFAAGGGLPEIYAYGFRNPWRFSFDRPSGRLFMADVGENSFEEIDIVQKGGNYGWNVMEGSHCFNPATGCNMTGLALPIVEYSHSEGNAVIGGYVYHGTSIPSLQNAYVFGDLGTGKVWGLQETNPGNWTRTLLATTAKTISSFGQDQSGELYLVDYAGSIFKIRAQ